MSKLRQQALNLLARREHTRVELKTKLSKKTEDLAELDLLLDKLTQQGLLSEQRFVTSFIRQRVNRGYGSLRIAAELRERGIPDHFIKDSFENESVDWQIQIQQVWQKRFGERPNDLKEKAKQARFLQYRGFDFQQIQWLFAQI